MVEPNQTVPALAGGNYWNPNIEAMDLERKRQYPSQPVPAHLNASQKDIDTLVRAELLVEHLATKGDFNPSQTLSRLHGLGQEEQMAAIREMITEVEQAPPEQQESAKRSLAGSLKGIGSTIGRGLLSGVNKVMGIPGVTPILSALSMPGEEVTAQILYNIARLVPGEQDIERGVNKWRAENPDAPWYKRASLTPAVRQEGFGVPMGLHLPMEIIFDPLNLIPLGALSRTGITLAKLAKKGHSPASAIQHIKRLNRAKKSAIIREEEFLKQAEEARRFGDADEPLWQTVDDPVEATWLEDVPAHEYSSIWDEVNWDPANGSYIGGRLENVLTLAARVRSTEQYFQSGGQAAADAGLDIAGKVQKEKLKKVEKGDKDGSDIGASDMQAGVGAPDVRGIPDNGSVEAPTGLYAIINDVDEAGVSAWENLPKAKIKGVDQILSKDDGRKAKWASELQFYTAIRPHEIPYLSWQSVMDVLATPGDAEKFLKLTMREGGAKSSKVSYRLLTDESIEFFKRYQVQRNKMMGGENLYPEKLAFELPTPVKVAKTGKKAIAKEDHQISGLNRAFQIMALQEQHATWGTGLLDFYRSNGNFSYVFRLSRANMIYQSSKTARGVYELMKIMGHASTVHTSRYISFFQHKESVGVGDLLTSLGKVTADYLNPASLLRPTGVDASKPDWWHELNDVTSPWRANLPEEDLKKLGELNLFTTVNRANQNRKGFADPTREAAIIQLNKVRADVLEAAIKTDEGFDAREFIFPRSDLSEAGVKEALDNLSQLQTFAINLIEAITEKNLIRNVKEVKEWKTYKGTKENKDYLEELFKSTTAEVSNMTQWFDPVLKLSSDYQKVLQRARDKATNPDDLKTFSKVYEDLSAVFTMMVHSEVTKLTADKGGRGGYAGRAYQKLSAVPIFKNLMTQNVRNKRTNKLTPTAEKARLEWIAKNPEEAAQLDALDVGWIVHPEATGKNIEATKQMVEKVENLIGNPKWNPHRTDLWMLTGWEKFDGNVFKVGDEPTEISHAVVEKLGSKPFKGDTITFHREQQTHRIPLLDFDAWALNSDQRLPMHMVRAAGHGGRAGLSADEVGDMLFKWGADASQNGRMGEMRDKVKKLYSDTRLKRNGHLVSSGKSDEYRWSNEVVAAFNRPRGASKKGGLDSDEWGWGADEIDGGETIGLLSHRGGTPIQPPPKGPGTSTDVPLPAGMPESNRIRWTEDGKVYSIGDTIVMPRGMRQVMTFAGENFKKHFDKIPLKFQKVIRVFIGQTFASSPAAKVRAKYMMAKGEASQVAENIGMILTDMHKSFGTNYRDGRGTKLRVKYDTGINPVDGTFTNKQILYEDYYRFEGVERTGTEINKDIARAAGRPLDEKQILGPLAVMEENFIEFKKAAPEIWGKRGKIESERLKFNHLASLQDMTTFLNTQRGDLHRFYDLSGAIGQDQLKWWDYYHQVGPHLIDMLRKAGHDVDNDPKILEKLAGEFRDSFVPSLFLERDQTLVQGAVSIGMKPAQMKTRSYHWQIENKMASGMGDGIIKHDLYNTDAVRAIQQQAEAYYDFVAQELFMDEFAKLGFLKAELDSVATIAELIKQTRIGQTKLSSAQRIMAAKFFGPAWRTMPVEKFAAREQELISMSANWRNLDLKQAVLGAPSEHILHHTALPPEASKELLALTSDVFTKQSQFITLPSQISNTMRLLATGADLGVMMLHGIGGIGMMLSPSPFLGITSPQRTAWAKSTWNMGRAMIQPNVRTEWYKSTQLVRRDMHKYGIGFFRSTHIEDMPLPLLFTKGKPRPQWTRKPGIDQAARGVELAWAIPERMMNGFGFFLDVSKTEMWKVQSKAVRSHFGSLNHANAKQMEEDALNDLAASLNATHGTLQPAAMGLPQKQRVIESAFLMYAALYKRSAIAMVNNLMAGIPSSVMRGGPLTEAGRAAAGARKWRRGPALEAMSGLLMAGTSIGWAVKSMGLNDDVFDMGSADFMSIKVGGVRLGLGTPYYSLIRASKDIIDQMADDPKGLGEVNFSDNALLKWFRSGSSPVTSIAVDIGMGQNFIGDPLRDSTGGWEVNKIGTRISRNLMPFWLDSLSDSVAPWGSKDMPASAALAEFFGFRGSPLSAYGRLLAAKNMAIQLSDDPDLVAWIEKKEEAGLLINPNEVPKLLMERLILNNPDIQAIQQEIHEDVQRRGSYSRKQQDDYIQQVKLNREGDGVKSDNNPLGIEGLQLKLLGLDEKFDSGELSGKEFRQEIEMLEQENRGRNQQLAATFKDVILAFEERKADRLNDPAGHFILDHWFDLYRSLVTANPTLHDEFGNFNSERFKFLQKWFQEQVDTRFPEMSSNGRDTVGWKYIQDRRNQKKLLPGNVSRLEEARSGKLLPFWNLPEQLGSRGEELIHNWRDQVTKEAKAYFQLKHPEVMRYLRRLNKIQERYRRTHPGVDALLVEFYDYKALTTAGMAIERKRRQWAIDNPLAARVQDTSVPEHPSLIDPNLRAPAMVS